MRQMMDAGHRADEIALADVSKLLLVFVAITETADMQVITMSARITAYSTAVGPSSDWTNRPTCELTSLNFIARLVANEL